MILGQWRVRPRLRMRQRWAWWMNRTRFVEGTVYRVSLGWLLWIVMVDKRPT